MSRSLVLNRNVIEMEYAVRGPIPQRAAVLRQQGMIRQQVSADIYRVAALAKFHVQGVHQKGQERSSDWLCSAPIIRPPGGRCLQAGEPSSCSSRTRRWAMTRLSAEVML